MSGAVESVEGPRRFRPYPEYKDSGVGWLGNIPADWEAKRLRFAVAFNPSKSEVRALPPDTAVSFVPMESVGEYGGLDLDETKPLESVLDGYTYFRDGDVVVAKITPCFENGKGAFVAGLKNTIGFGTTELTVLRPQPATIDRFLFYVTMSAHFRLIGAAEMYGAGGQKRVPDDFIRNLEHPLPGRSEQRAIAGFLDRETGKIDALVAKKERLIELLREKRTALITHAVTKGLDPAVPMKASGVDWLGEIPAHWETKPNGHLFRERDERGYPDLPILNVSLNTGVTLRDFSAEKIEQQSEDRSVYKRSMTGDIAFNKMRMWQGAVGVTPTEGLVSPDYTVASPFVELETKYFELLFRTSFYKTEINRYSHGIVPDRNRLYWDEFKQIKSTFPPVEEQSTILEWIEVETAGKHERLAAKVGQAIDCLKEYRTALISAAVTGKIDVREEAA